MAHDHHHDHAHGERHHGHSHASTNFGCTFLIAASLNGIFIIAEVIYFWPMQGIISAT
jgi:cobalt-zinc-cadmium efflux system protein